MSRRVVVLVLAVVLAGCAGGPVGPSGEGTPDPTATPFGATASANGTLAVHFINVGQSTSVLVVGPAGETMLVDTGHYTDDGEYVIEYLQHRGIDRVDHLVSSHNDADHIGGHADIVEHYETEAEGIAAVYDPGIAASTQTYEQYLRAVERHDVTLYETREGDEIPMEGLDVRVLGPPDPYIEDRARNENSIVLALSFGGTRLLLTGDAENDQERYLVDRYGARLNATALKAGHHGSSSSTGGPLLDAARPRVAVISSAYDSQYGHPHDEVLRRLSERSVRTYWTATHGTVVLRSDGEATTVFTQRSAPTDPQRLRDAPAVDPRTDNPLEPRLTLDGAQVPEPTPVATDGGTPTTDGTATADGTPSVAIADIHEDAEGPDGENLNDEYVVLENRGSESVDLAGWTLTDEAGKTYTFPDGATLDAGARVTVHSGSGTDTATDRYWAFGSPVWNNDGDTATLRSADETVVAEVTYP